MLPLSGGLVVDVDGTRYPLAGQASVFDRVTDFAYVPRDAEITLSSQDGCEVALPMARCQRRLRARTDRPRRCRSRCAVRTRHPSGHNFGVPGVWEHADKLSACELITPDGNWSSYPPHKHDGTEPCEVANEEIYYFRIAGRDGVRPSREGFGLHRTYTDDGTIRRTSWSPMGTCSSSRAATTDPVSPRPAARCTTSTCSPGRRRNARWHSATIQLTRGCGTCGARCRLTRVAR